MNKIVIELEGNYDFSITVRDGVVSVYNDTLGQDVYVDNTTSDDGTVFVQNYSLNKYISTLNTSQIYKVLCEYIDTEEAKYIDPNNLYQTNGNGETVLHEAVCEGNLKVVKYIIHKTKGELLSYQTSMDEYTPLHLAVCNGFNNMIGLVVNKIKKYNKSELFNTLTIRRETAFHIAVGKDDLYACRLLYELTSDEAICNEMKLYNNSKSEYYNESILRCALRSGSKSMVEILLLRDTVAKTLLSKTDCYGQNMLHIAFDTSFFGMSKFLIDRVLCLQSEDNEIIKTVFLCQSTEDGHTPLHIAVQRSNVLVVEYLIEKIYGNVPEMISLPDNYGQTPLIWAIYKKNFEVCKLLYSLMNAEDIMKPSVKGLTCLTLAIQCESPDISILNLLLSKLEIDDEYVSSLLQLTSCIKDTNTQDEFINVLTQYKNRM